jgi:hypothetical protein
VPLHVLARQRLVARFPNHDLEHRTDVAHVPLRVPVTVVGEVTCLRVVPRAGSPPLEMTLDDGTGTVLVVFTGRRRIGGIDPGRAVTVEGVARQDHGGVVMLNPRYTLLDSPS